MEETEEVVETEAGEEGNTVEAEMGTGATDLEEGTTVEGPRGGEERAEVCEEEARRVVVGRDRGVET